jgi:FkbM family methyltransferase
LHSRYPGSSLRDGFEMIEAAVSDTTGTMAFQISGDLYNSSLIQVGLTTTTSIVEVPVTTVDDIVSSRNVTGRGLLKVDVQYAEHLVLAGAKRALQDMVDFVLLELTLYRANERARTFAEMINLMSELGFDYYDDVGEWRSPINGRLEQRDALFVRRGSLGLLDANSGKPAEAGA